MADTKQITWKISRWDNIWSKDQYGTDKVNLQSALTRIRTMDEQAASEEEIQTVNRQLALPQTPDDLSQSISQRAKALCNAGDERPIKFLGQIPIRNESPDEGATTLFLRSSTLPGYEDYRKREWSPFSENGKDIIRQLNGLALDKRAAVQLRFEVTFGNNKPPFNWSVALWMETIIHEVGIHVAQKLHYIEVWRNGGFWPGSDRIGELDHYLFRYRGYKRYQLWRNRMDDAEIREIWPNLQVWEEKQKKTEESDLVKLLFQKTEGKEEQYDVNDCQSLAMHFPTPNVQLVRKVAAPDEVDQVQSQQFIAELKAMVQEIFEIGHGSPTGKKALYYWWHIK